MRVLLTTAAALLVSAAALAQPYCPVAVTFPCALIGGPPTPSINHVICGNINQLSGCQFGYEDFTASQSVTIVSGGAGVAITVLVAVIPTTTVCQVDVCVDWDGDHLFGANEQITLAANGLVFTGTLFAPLGGAIGPTRMRIITNFATGMPLPSCGVLPTGNVEDYTVIVANNAALYQENLPQLAFDVDSIIGTGQIKAVVTRTADNVCTFGGGVAHIASPDIGNPWDVALTASPAVANGAGGFVTTGGQVVNVNVGDPSFVFLNGGTLTIPFLSALALPVVHAAPFNITGQAIILDGALVDGFALSQPTDYRVVMVSPDITMVNLDDAVTIVNLANPALCHSLGSFTFYGTNYTQIGVSTNGRVLFGTAGTGNDSSPAVTGGTTIHPSADGGAPFVGAWSNFNPSFAAAAFPTLVTTSTAPGLVRVQYTSFPYYIHGGGPYATFTITLDQVTSQLSISGINTIGLFSVMPLATNTNMFLGVSRGVGATDPGNASWTLGMNPAPPLASDMNYRFGQGGTLTTGISTLTFIPSAGNYSVLAF